ncbi:MAG TPA: four helix bundle protein [Candidatus Paceibacterota bacterium]|jgi:four helix bundle protein|nr:four helix bundle protein [Candidatus Paceibacterota bacterium]
MQYDLEERTDVFGESVIDFVKKLSHNDYNKPLVSQVIRSATSIGANYLEANRASSKKDFRNKISICNKESNETKHWLRMISRANPEKSDQCRILWKEAHELVLIFSKIFRSSTTAH